jgi:hypothetical protein
MKRTNLLARFLQHVRQRPGRSRPRCVRVTAQGHLLRVKIAHTWFKATGGTRGKVGEFSSNSRKRMLESLARIDTGLAGFTCFVTLTYPDREGPPSPGETERDRQTFLKRLLRKHPTASGFWRREWEVRESGAFAGELFPHYHLLCFGLPYVHHSVIRETWAEVIGHEGYVRTEIKGVESWRQAMLYVSKYMAKPAAASQAVEGPPATDGGAAAGSLVYSAYLTGEKRKSLGRSWGKFNRARLPWAKSSSALLTLGDWIEKARAEAAAVFPLVAEYGVGQGFTLFVEHPEEWLPRLKAMAEDDKPGGDTCPR